MTKKSILTLLLALATLTMAAQEKLVRIDSQTLDVRAGSPRLSLFYSEMNRLLLPQGAGFGVVVTPSNGFQSALSYDARAGQLVYKVAESSIWKATKNPDQYQAPAVKTYTLDITARQARKLMEMWRDAVGSSEVSPDNMLDGSRWEFFFTAQRAKATSANHPLVKLVEQLQKAVQAGDPKMVPEK
jgi:hypothetical protein